MKLMESPTVRRLFDRWESDNVRYCHWKSSNHMEAALSGRTDLDVLVAAEDSVPAERAAAGGGFVLMKTAALRQYPGIHDYLAYDNVTDRFIHLHLHYQMVIGDRWVKAYRLPVERELLARRIWSSFNRTWIVSPMDEILTFCARLPVKYNRPFSQVNIVAEADYLVGRIEKAEDVGVIWGYPNAVKNLAVCLVENGAQSITRSQLKWARAEMRGYLRMTRWHFVQLSLVRCGYRLAMEFNRRIVGKFHHGRRRLPKGGTVVAFVGMDGAGKTSAVKRATIFFAQQMDVESVFLGSGMSGAPWYRRLAFVVLGTRAKLKNHKKVHEAISQPKKVPIYYLAWNLLCSKDRIVRLKNAFRSRSIGRLVLVDRWPQDTLTKGFDSRSLRNISNKDVLARYTIATERKVVHLSNEFGPDMVFRFKVTPEVAVSRKPDDLSLSDAQRMQIDLPKIEWPNNSVVIDVDADQSIGEIDRFIRDRIWSHIVGRL